MKHMAGVIMLALLVCGCSSTRFLHTPFLESQVTGDAANFVGEWEGVNLMDKSRVCLTITLESADADVNEAGIVIKGTVTRDGKSEKVIPLAAQAFKVGDESFVAVHARTGDEAFWTACGYGGSSVFLVRPYIYVVQIAPFQEDMIVRLVNFFPSGDGEAGPLSASIRTAADDRRLVLNPTAEIQAALWEKKYELENYLQIRRVKPE